jgi:hypothetical protein
MVSLVMIKTIAKILFVIALVWSLAFIFKVGNSFASNDDACGSGNWSWSVRDNPGLANPYMIRFDFNNNSEKVAKISGVKIFTQSNKLIYERTFYKRGTNKQIKNPMYIKPLEKTFTALAHGMDLPWDIIKKASIDCESITFDQYEDELIAAFNNKKKLTNKNDFDDLQKELYQGCYESADQLTDQRAKEYCRCVTLMITGRYEDSQILEIGKKSEAYQRSRFAFAGKHCNLNAKALGDE